MIGQWLETKGSFNRFVCLLVSPQNKGSLIEKSKKKKKKSGETASIRQILANFPGKVIEQIFEGNENLIKCCQKGGYLVID